MGEVKKIKVRKRTYYLYNDIIDLKKIDARLLRIDKNSYKNTGICNIGYSKIYKIDYCEKIYGVNPLYLNIDHAS